jgi:hypothetical protein
MHASRAMGSIVGCGVSHQGVVGCNHFTRGQRGHSVLGLGSRLALARRPVAAFTHFQEWRCAMCLPALATGTQSCDESGVGKYGPC